MLFLLLAQQIWKMKLNCSPESFESLVEDFICSHLLAQTTNRPSTVPARILCLDRLHWSLARRIDGRDPSLVAGHWAKWLCGWNSGLGAGKEGEWTEGRLDPSLTETGQPALLLLAGWERNSSPDLAWSLLSIVWNGLHLQRCQKQMKNHAQAK